METWFPERERWLTQGYIGGLWNSWELRWCHRRTPLLLHNRTNLKPVNARKLNLAPSGIIRQFTWLLIAAPEFVRKIKGNKTFGYNTSCFFNTRRAISVSASPLLSRDSIHVTPLKFLPGDCFSSATLLDEVRRWKLECHWVHSIRVCTEKDEDGRCCTCVVCIVLQVTQAVK